MPRAGQSPTQGAVPVARGAAPAPGRLAAPEPGRPWLLLGEVRTTVLRNSVPITGATAQEVLRLKPAGRVRLATRPIAYARSPELVTGVHCLLASGQRRRVETVGTVLAGAAVLGGRVLQASAWTAVATRDWDFRPPWSDFLATPGVVYASAKAAPDDLAAGFLRPEAAPGGPELDLGGAAAAVLDQVQGHPALDRGLGLRAQRTRLRFAIRVDDQDGPIRADSAIFAIHDDALRTISLTVSGRDPAPAVRLCEDVALHDWLLTTVGRVVDGARAGGTSGEELIRRSRPVVTHLLPLWMPGAHVAEELAPVWAGLDRRPGFSRQWTSLVDQIRDQLALSMIGLLSRGWEGQTDRL
ncbi:SCO2521 family protein [Pseudofrankia inefficax]|uniref:Uncharacterized protein n=1 Tax=Pseudofrankia inefficax (strain DSM 45817 / CECT 9037 / DDB 130130 / EuI1c) TaxID=298654 RepID=E3IWF1_PSEI1|nr:SCO2521 family protein [Pseudofrankia inefficax]ADP80134.1 hypothetical protein FraEuI1c_2084 [Pseudofrankia inefficax]